MKKITDPIQIEILHRIKNDGGTYCPSIDLDPAIVRALRELVKAKRLTVEPNDGAPDRYTLTSLGWADAP